MDNQIQMLLGQEDIVLSLDCTLLQTRSWLLFCYIVCFCVYLGHNSGTRALLAVNLACSCHSFPY